MTPPHTEHSMTIRMDMTNRMMIPLSMRRGGDRHSASRRPCPRIGI